MVGERLEKTKKHIRSDSRSVRIDLNQEVEASANHPQRRTLAAVSSSAEATTGRLHVTVLSCKLVL